jgi:hypothetical protein
MIGRQRSLKGLELRAKAQLRRAQNRSDGVDLTLLNIWR